MNILDQKILDLITIRPNLNLKELKKGLKLNDKEEELFINSINNLEINGILYKNNNDRFSILDNKTKLKYGKAHLLQSGDICVITNDDNEIIIEKKYAKDIYDKDFIIVKNIVQDKKNKLYGLPDKILKRNKNNIIFEIILENNNKILSLYNNKGIKKINNINLDKYNVGDIVIVDINNNKIIEKLGSKNEPDIDEIAIAYNHGFINTYSDKFLEELKKIPTKIEEKDYLTRKDLTKEKLFTIDGVDTKDMDDAVGIKKLDNGNYVLYVSIADVAHYVKDNTKICSSAYEKGTSLYMNDTVIHMLHPYISNGICSLNPNEERLTKTCEILLDKDGNVINYEIYDSVIISKKKMNYDDVNKILINNEKINGYEDFYDDLFIMNELSKKLNIIKTKRGYIDFVKDDFKASGKEDYIIFKKKKQLDAEKLIENFMLLANESVSEYISYMNLPFIYRVHEAPSEEKVKSFLEELYNIGYNFKNCKSITSNKYLQNVINELSKNEDSKETLIELLLRTMKRAKYSNENIGHFGLALNYYTHFTSPIRRYSDLQVHKLLDLYKNCTNINYDDLNKKLNEIAIHCTKRSFEADKAEIEARELRMAEYMENHIGEEFEGIITSINKTGLSIISQEGITGKVKYTTNNNFTLDNQNKKLIDNRNNKEYYLGSKIKFIVKYASKVDGNIIYEVNYNKKVLKKDYNR